MKLRHDKEELQRTLASQLEQLQAPHHAVLLDELKHSQEKMQTLQVQVEQFTAKERQYRTKMDEFDTKIRKVKGKLAEATSACRNLSEEIEQEQLKLDHGTSERRSCQQKLNEDKQKIGQVEAILKQKFDVIKENIADAERLCPRIDNPRDKTLVENELKKTQLKLSSLRSDGLTKAQVAEKLLEVERKYRKTADSLKKVKELIADIKKVSEKHLRFCIQVQTHISRRIQVYFQDILTVRGYSGCMEIDHARSLLEIKCTGRESSSKRHASSTSSLSGGERSYSTVAFFMALWDCVELPFYFLDEFDVFMVSTVSRVCEA
ncbi:structural maintenance of chromosomes protein 6-like [Hyposmocoma kahamanoa]|uniref:structural maintenance of chromosomes protein 6-like n=1 Tax=Hyposmocoma kahamanoa TaxID=1477025 RepID=UPI000E6DA021|nr:structural maintenance of chromosomes protein 6-like [Hyposmocoma kahamanoa]